MRRLAIAVLLVFLCASFSGAQQTVQSLLVQPAVSTANITSTTCPGSGCLSVGTSNYGVATVTVHGTYAGVTIAFQISDDGGTTYYPTTCTRVDTAVQETGEVLPTNQSRAWDCGVYATTQLRVSASAYTSGTAVYNVTLSTAPIEPAPTIGGSVTASQSSGASLETAPVTTAVTTDTASRCTLTSAASTNATNCKASSGNVYGFRFVNTTATLYYLRMYNLATSPTCSSATGFVETIPIPASATGAGIVAIEPMGEGYSTGIAFCFTGGSSSTDNTNAATGVFGTILYK